MHITEPPCSEWPALVQRNKEVARVLHGVIGEHVVREQRAEILAAARDYTDAIIRKAAGVGVTIPPIKSREATDSIVMAGHQPVVYHPGLLFKSTKLFELGRDTGAISISIVIDTDEGDAGRLVWPFLQKGSLTLRHGTLAEGDRLYRGQRVRSIEAVRELFAEVVKDLSESGLPDVAARVERVLKLYQSLAGESIAIANAIVRFALQGRATLEVPLSKLCETPSFQARARRIVEDRERFVSLYNETLRAYREEHGIKNPANPFPNMAVNDDFIELPFWTIEGGERKPVYVSRSSSEPKTFDQLLVPRGSMVTFLLRSACADLFIHGLGGGKYDRFVDLFAKAYWGVSLPSFVVASETRHLFSGEVKRFRFARDIRAKYKELVSHTDTFIGKGLFSSEDEGALRPLVFRRAELLESLKVVTTPDDRRPIVLALNELNHQIKACIERSSLSTTLAEGAIDDATLGRWEYREFPFFFFDL